MPYKRRVLLGIVGDSAAGKTTLSSGIARILGEERVTLICTDDYHRYNRRRRRELGLTALDPACNYIDIIEQHLDLLRQGQPILKPVYNHTGGDFDTPEYIQPQAFVIVEGLLACHSKQMRDNFDVTVYLAPEEDLRLRWKIKRDIMDRGYKEAEVRASLVRRAQDSRRFIHAQKESADMVVTFHRPAKLAEESGPHLNARLVLRPTLPQPDLSDVLEQGESAGRPMFTATVSRQAGRLIETLEIDGQIGADLTARLEEVIWSHLPALQSLPPEEIGQFSTGRRTGHSNPLALTQLLITYHLLTAMQALQEDLAKRPR